MTSADSLSPILRRLDEIERKLDRMMEELRTPTAIGYSVRRGNRPRKDWRRKEMSIYDEYRIVINKAQRRLIMRALTNAMADDRRSTDAFSPRPEEWMQLIRLFSSIEPSSRKAQPWLTEDCPLLLAAGCPPMVAHIRHGSDEQMFGAE
jgi:hypothetical protein